MPTQVDQEREKSQNDSLMKIPEFDFDEWVALHKNDPEAFEEKRIEWLTNCVVDAPKQYQKRLNGLVFHVNSVRQIEKNPMQTCIKVSSMMLDSLNDMRAFLCDLNSTLQGSDNQTKANKTSADVLQFVRN